MPHEIVFTALVFALIVFLVLLVLVVLFISQARESRLGLVEAFAFAIAIIGLYALITFGMMATKVQQVKSFLSLFSRV